jgi:two-component system, NarL family, sensor histidine kinase DesK
MKNANRWREDREVRAAWERDAGPALPGPGAAGRAEAAWIAGQRKWVRGWRRTVFPGVFLVYLLSVITAVQQYSRGGALIAGWVIAGLFSAGYLFAIGDLSLIGSRRFWPLFAVLAALTVAELPFARADTFVMCVYLAVLLVSAQGGRAAPAVIVMTLASVLVPVAVPAWHDGLATSVDNGSAIAIPITALAMFGFFNVLHGNRALAEARSELARLAAENERSRIARDLHDLLGHSLTTITVKAELARHLGSRDISAALREIAEVEALSRRALADVRAAVTNYREVSLAGELASGRELLRAAGIAPDFPATTEVVDAEAQELFGWVLREGLTNVARHSHAHTCTVRITGTRLEITDDGVGTAPGCGTGLSGLRERVEAAGGTLEAGPVPPRGWRLLATLGQLRLDPVAAT